MESDEGEIVMKSNWSVVVGQDEEGVFLAWWKGELDGDCGAGDSELSAIACLCAITEINDDGVERKWHAPFIMGSGG